jgi:uncharacterized repeat protein (TIGR02543 family)
MRRQYNILFVLFAIIFCVLIFSACSTQEYKLSFSQEETETGTLPAFQNIKAGENWTVPDCTLAKREYEFKYWTDGENNYSSGEVIKMPKKDLVLNAVWEKINPTNIIYNYGLGSSNETVIDSSGAIYKGDIFTFKDKHSYVKKAGFTFAGWCHNEVEYSIGDTIIAPKEDMVLYAIWKDRELVSIAPVNDNRVTIGNLTALDELRIACTYDNGEKDTVTTGIVIDKTRVNFEILGNYTYDISYGGLKLENNSIIIIDRDDTSLATARYTGEGTQTDPRLVYTTYQFTKMYSGSNGSTKFYKLAKNLDFSDLTKYSPKNLSYVNFDGNSKKLLNITQIITGSGGVAGVFNVLDHSSISNLIIEDMNVNVTLNTNYATAETSIIVYELKYSNLTNISSNRCVVTNNALENKSLYFGAIAYKVGLSSSVTGCNLNVDVVKGDKSDRIAAFAYTLSKSSSINNSTVTGTFDLNISSNVLDVYNKEGSVNNCTNNVIGK